MVCQYCFKYGHDKQYCPTIFCKELINEFIDLSINEVITNMSMLSDEIVTILLMSKHDRVGKKSYLRNISSDIILYILEIGNNIELYKSRILNDRKHLSNVLLKLKNKHSHPISIFNDYIFTVSNNKNINYTDLGLKHSSNQFTFISKLILRFLFTNDGNLIVLTKKHDSHFQLLCLKKFSRNLIWCYNIHYKVIDIILHKNNLVIITTEGIQKIEINDNNITFKIRFKQNIEYISQSNNHVYHYLKDNTIVEYNLDNNKAIHFVFNYTFNNIHLLHTENDLYIYMMDQKNILITNNKFIKYILEFDFPINYKPIIIPTIFDVIIITSMKKIEYYDKHKINIWSITLRSNVSCQPYINKNYKYLYVGTIDKYMHKICIQSGTLLWKTKIKGVPSDNILYHNGMIYVQTTSPSNLIEIAS